MEAFFDEAEEDLGAEFGGERKLAADDGADMVFVKRDDAPGDVEEAAAD